MLLAKQFGPDAAVLAAAGSMLGDTFPIWLGFKGGKGVATAIGVLAPAISWPVGLIACATWLLVAFALTNPSLSALVALRHFAGDGVVFRGDRRWRSLRLHRAAGVHPPPRQYPPSDEGRGAEDRI